MRVYTCTDFTGHYPVGAAAVVVAPNRKRAAFLLEQALEKEGLKQTIDPMKLVILPTNRDETCIVLVNGNY